MRQVVGKRGGAGRHKGLAGVAALSGLTAGLLVVPPPASGATAAQGGGRLAHAVDRTKDRRQAEPPHKAKAVALPKVTGNAAAIAFYRKVVKATTATDGVEELYSPQAPLTQARYVGKRLAWTEWQPKKSGFAPAADVVFVGALHGKVTFVADSVLYAGKGTTFPNFGLLLTGKGEVVLGGGALARTTPVGKKTTVFPCAGPYAGQAFVDGYAKVGVPFGYLLYGHFDPIKLADKGKVYEITSTYPWSKTPARTATEVDTVPLATGLPSEGVIHVSAGGKLAGFSVRWANVWYHTPLYPPATKGTCSAYVKGVP